MPAAFQGRWSYYGEGMMHLEQLAARPAGADQIARAHEIIGDSPQLQQRFATFMATEPTRGQMLEFLETVRDEAQKVNLRERIDAICQAAGIEQPSGADRLMAMQIGLLQEQNVILRDGLTRMLNQMRADAQADAKADVANAALTTILGGVMLGAVLTR